MHTATSGDLGLSVFGNHSFEITSSSGVSLSCSVVAVLIKEKLSEEALEETLDCQAVNDQCLVVDGEAFPVKCQFPFIKNGRKYQGCTDVGSLDNSR